MKRSGSQSILDARVFSLPGIRSVLCGLAVFSLVKAFAIIGQAWALSSAIVNLWNGASASGQVVWLVAFLACFVSRQALVYAQDVYLGKYAQARADDLRQDLLSCMFRRGSTLVQEYGTGSISALVLEGVDQVETYLRLILPKTIGVVVVPFVLLCCIAPLDWVSGLIALVAFPFIILYMIILGHTARDEAAKQHATFQELSNTFVDALRGIEVLKLFGQGKAYGEKIYSASERFRGATMKTLRVAMLSSTVLDLFATGSLAAVAIMLGFRLIDGSIAFFPALVVLVLVPEYFKPVREFAADYHASLEGKNALAAILEITAHKDKEDACDVRELPLWTSESTFALRGVGFSYSDHEALEDITFEMQGALRVGIVGLSGAGKSTLVNVLGGFASTSCGTFSVDGVELPALNCPQWQRQVAYIPQAPYIFHASLRDNVAFYCPDASDDRVLQAMEVMGLSSLVADLPQGLDTLIGEGARTLSGGQAQRIALARAFLDDSRKVLLFDEPTAHLDIETEYELKEKMLSFMEGKLVFFATHRLHWMEDMDLVLVVEDGRIVEWGSPSDLLSRGGAFVRLVSQLGGEEL